MFFEVGFKFRKLVPEWFRVSTPKAEVDRMRRVAEELQHLLTAELLEWQQVTSGVQCRVVSPLDARNLNDHSEEMKPEDVESDSLIRGGATWNPASSSLGEPESKRQQHAPPRPSSIPSMSLLMSYRTSTPDDRSMVTPRHIGNPKWISDAKLRHMQFAHALPAGMVFAAQGGATQPEGSLGVQVTEAVLPVSPMPANPDDVVMSESGRAIIRN
ncbi:hypothetical protein PHMEG_00035429, partial [Phytophthora megakarya]